MAIDTTVNLIQAVNATISGVTTCPQLSAYPLKADTADLPLCLTVPGPGTWHHKGIGGALKRQDRTYQIVVFVEPVIQSQFPRNALATAQLMQAFIEMWLNVNLSNGAAVTLADPPPYQVTVEESEASPHSDEGIRSDLMIGGNPYHGFILSLRVRELW